jgi:hypothetical protein
VGRRSLPEKSKIVKVSVSPALHAHLMALVGFGWGIEPADVLRTLATREIIRLQDAGRLPDRPPDA